MSEQKGESMRVFKMNDCDWYMARSLDEAIGAVLKDHGWAFQEDRLAEGDVVDSPEEVSDDDMQRLRFMSDDGSSVSFAEQFAVEVAKDSSTPRLFASTEW